MDNDLRRKTPLPGDSESLAEILSSVPRSGRWTLPALSSAFRGTDGSTIEPTTRALVLLRVAAVDNSPYWRLQLEAEARALGLTDDQITLVNSDEWEMTGGFAPRATAAILWADRVARRLARRDARAYKTVSEVYSQDEVVELTLLAGLASMATRLTNSLRIAPEAGSGLVPSTSPAPDLGEWPVRMFDDDLAAAWRDHAS